MICFPRVIFLGPPNIMPQLAQAADDRPGDVLVDEKTHLQPKGALALDGVDAFAVNDVLRIGEAGLDIFTSQVVVLLDDLVSRVAAG
jgi:hypothetical protein